MDKTDITNKLRLRFLLFTGLKRSQGYTRSGDAIKLEGCIDSEYSVGKIVLEIPRYEAIEAGIPKEIFDLPPQILESYKGKHFGELYKLLKVDREPELEIKVQF